MEILPKQINVKVGFLKKIKPDVLLLGLKSDYLTKNAQPGQFVHIKVDDKVTILRRPFSIHRVKQDIIYILFKVRGRGTKLLARYKKGDTLDTIGPLGRGFKYAQRTPHKSGAKRSLPEGDAQRILVAGGMGVAPLLFLAEKIKAHSAKRIAQSVVLLGAKNKKDILAKNEFKKLGYRVYVATDDGSYGFHGTVIPLLKRILAMRSAPCAMHIYACGPKEMFFELGKVLKEYPQIDCQVSFEQFMGCGLGICCGCVIETKSGYRKVCQDGPVFNLKDIC